MLKEYDPAVCALFDRLFNSMIRANEGNPGTVAADEPTDAQGIPTADTEGARAFREAVELIAKCSDGLSSSDQCQLVELAGSVALRGGRPLALVKSLAADRDASEGQPNGIGFYGLVRNVRDAALASIDAGGDFVAVGKDVSRAILGASMPSARAAWSIASDIATRTAASAAEKGLRCPARHMLASGAEGAARAAAPSRGAGR